MLRMLPSRWAAPRAEPRWRWFRGSCHRLSTDPVGIVVGSPRPACAGWCEPVDCTDVIDACAGGWIKSLDRSVRTRWPGCSTDYQHRVENDFPCIGSPVVEALDDGLDGTFRHLACVLSDGGEIDEG